MAFLIPAYNAYPNEISPIPSREATQPSEGKQYAPLELDWATNGQCQLIDLGSRCTRPFSQIVMLDVDNTACTADAEFLFPDSQTTLVVPAGSGGRYPVTTSGIRFYANAVQQPLSNDVTRVAVLNFLSLPIDVPRTEFVATSVSSIAGVPPVSAQIVPVGVNGIMASAQIVGWVSSGATIGTMIVTIEDGNNNVMATCLLSAPANSSSPGAIVLDLQNVAVRFTNGVKLSMINGPNVVTGGYITYNFYYRTN